ncbi:(-)-germacrene D synthase [Vitis vinifera]|uniref:(-)-germacrene D synthase n=1 Tax=Vitis vinifera TaxID=29760 RepID=A0A438ID94_VITVI|nr:(-)-germacrene D synthase [Vitis vinifera]
MSVQSSVVLLAQSQNATPAVARRCANFHPSIWGHRFLSYASEFTNANPYLEQQVQQLKEEVRMLLITAADDSEQKLHLIDAIQRLGLAYHLRVRLMKHYSTCSMVTLSLLKKMMMFILLLSDFGYQDNQGLKYRFYGYIGTLILRIYRKYRKNIGGYFFTNIDRVKII